MGVKKIEAAANVLGFLIKIISRLTISHLNVKFCKVFVLESVQPERRT